MFQPGKESNIPSSSGAPMGLPVPDFMGKQVFKVDGITVTIGLVILAVAVLWLYVTFAKKGR